MKFRILVLAFASLFVFSGCAMFSGLMGGGASPELKKSQDAIVSAYDGSFAKIYEAQLILLEALGHKELADKYKAESGKLAQSSTNKASRRVKVETSNEINKAIEEKDKASAEMTEKQAARAKEAIMPYIQGNAKAAGMIAISAKFLTDAANAIAANPTQALALKSELEVGMDIAKYIPEYVKANTSVISSVISLLKKSGIDTSDIEKASKDSVDQGAE